MISTQRPVVSPGRWAVFGYLDGKFYWGNKTHPEIAAYLQTHGYPRQKILSDVIWGTVYNNSDGPIPEYVFEPQSDYFAERGYNPSSEMLDKLKGMFPGLTIEHVYPEEHRGKTSSKELVDAFVYLPAIDRAFIGQNHPDILARAYDEIEQERDEGYDIPSFKEISRMGVYGWIWRHGNGVREAEIYSDTYERFNLTHDTEIQRAINEVNRQLPRVDWITEWTTGPPEDVRDEMNAWSKVLGTWADNVWYHTTSTNYLPSILKRGLQPGTGQNWPGLPVGQAIYLWPNAGSAFSYQSILQDRSGLSSPVFLRISNIDRMRLAPDHESFDDWLSNRREEKQRQDVWDGLDYSHKLYQQILAESPTLRQNEIADARTALQILQEITPDLRSELAREISEVYNYPVMYFGPINADHIQVAKANVLDEDTLDELQQQYSRLHQPPEVDNDDEYDQWLEAFDQWVMEQDDWIGALELEEALEYSFEDYEDSTADVFRFDPLKTPDVNPQMQLNLFGSWKKAEVTKFSPGDQVVMKAYGESGVIHGDPQWNEGRWWYYVDTYDEQGPVGLVQYPEEDLERPSRYDRPETLTLQDLFDITPEGEDYYRQASLTEEWLRPGDRVRFTGNIQGLNQLRHGAEWTYLGTDDGEVNFRDLWNYAEPLHFPESVVDLWLSRGLLSIQSEVPNTIPWSEREQEYYRTSAYEYGQPGHDDYDPNHDPNVWNVGDKLAMPVFDSFPTLWDYFIISDMTPNAIVLREAEVYHESEFTINRDKWISWCREWQVQRIEEGGTTEEYADKMWPDTLPWDENEQDYYRTAKWYRHPWTRMADSATIQPVDASMLINDQISASPAAKTAIQALTQAGGQVHVVGGAVRDAMMNKSPKDIDLMCSGLSGEQIASVLAPLGRVDFTGQAFGVYRFKTGGDEVEIALPRTERSTGSGHKDFEVTADPYLSAEDDLRRRDFTINAMAYNPGDGSFLDPHGGAKDLEQGRLALVNDQAFHDDPLRIVRALVASARYGFTPDPALLHAMQDQASAIRHLPGERVQMELDKLLSAPDPATAFEMAEQTGVLNYLAPELVGTVGFSQYNPHHDLDVWEHTLQVLRKASQLSNDPDVRLAALFHDSGKPDSFWQDPDAPEGGGGHFYMKKQEDGTILGADHEEVSGDLVSEFMKRLRYPTKRIEKVESLVRNHMFPYFDSSKGARKFLKRVDGDPKLANDLLLLREADASGKTTGEMNDFDSKKVEQARNLVQQALENNDPVGVGSLAINGHDLIQMGMKPGPEIGRILNDLTERVIEEPELNDRDTLLGMVRGYV
jgi:tRNA nucleotidyltransferase (CCA-adding enzyme)